MLRLTNDLVIQVQSLADKVASAEKKKRELERLAEHGRTRKRRGKYAYLI